MKRFLIAYGKLTTFGAIALVILGLLLLYLSIEFAPWKWLKILGLCAGLGIALIGGLGGRAHALGLPPPFTNDPLGWRKAKKTYREEQSEEAKEQAEKT
jgi:hypothetical protein